MDTGSVGLYACNFMQLAPCTNPACTVLETRLLLEVLRYTYLISSIKNSSHAHTHTHTILSALTSMWWKQMKLEMWANAQRDGRPAEYRWHPLFNAAVWLTPTIREPCSNAAKTRNPLKLPGLPETNERISAASGPKFTILWGHVGEVLLLNKFFSDCRYMP